MDQNSFRRLAQAEDEFFKTQFISPVLRGWPIRIRIAGVVVSLKVTQWIAGYDTGWRVLQPISFDQARVVRDASMSERQSYLKLFPSLHLILCRRIDDRWYGIPANQADTRFKIAGLVPIQLVEEVQLFQHVLAAFDGQTCWYDQVDQSRPPAPAKYLRESLQQLVEPVDLGWAGLTQEEKDAYLMAYGPRLEADVESKRDKQEERLKAAIERAGGSYQSYIERGNTFTVEYRMGGEVHRSVVDKDTLGVQSAGICLSGTDAMYDLQSLCGVIAEGIRRRRIVRVGNNYGNPGEGDDGYEDDS